MGNKPSFVDRKSLSEHIHDEIEEEVGEPIILMVLSYLTESGHLYVKYAGYEGPDTKMILQKELPSVIARSLGGEVLIAKIGDA